MTEHLQERTLREVMAGVGETVREAGADVIGGHSATASELSLGVTVTGLIEGPMFKGAGPGDALILTKPLGVGTVMAAEMRGLARGEEVVAALSSMQRSMVQDAAILSPRAHAMTDVTGFGLAGHLASFGVGAELYLATLPILPGAERLAEQGLRSSLYSSNVQAAPVIGPSEAKASLLHDPQTAGGLLAAVPEEVVEDILAAFPHAVRIGTVIEGPQVTILR
jgi:selenide,water dikinase